MRWTAASGRVRLPGAALILIVAACGGPAATSAVSTTPAVTVGSPASVPNPATSAVSRPTTSVVSSAVTSGSTSTTQTTTTTGATTIEIVGSEEFVEHTQTALALLKAQAPTAHEQVVAFISTIESVASGSGMDVFTKTFLVGDVTAFAPGFPQEQQVVWYASTMVHDSCHSRQYASGDPYTGETSELACLGDQLDALQILDVSSYFASYVQGLIDGVDDPQNQYWNDPNRHW